MGICFLQDLFKKIKVKGDINPALTDVSHSAGRGTPTHARRHLRLQETTLDMQTRCIEAYPFPILSAPCSTPSNDSSIKL